MFPLKPSDLLWARAKTQQDQSKYYDKFGDSYKDSLDETKALQHVLNKVRLIVYESTLHRDY